MSYNRKEKNKITITILKLLTIFFASAFFLTFLININENIGIIPLVFISLVLYSIISIIYPFVIAANNPYVTKTVIKINIVYIIFAIINLILTVLSIIVLWL